MVQILGVNTHTSWPSWVAQKPQVLAALRWLGVKHVRDIWGFGLATLTDYEVLSICTTAAQVEESITKYGAKAVEGPNEQNSKVTDAALRAAQAEVCATARGRVPVLSCSINQLRPYATLGRVACDVASLHVYRDGATDRATYQARLQKALTTEASMVAPGKPVWVTETGWFNGGDTTRQVTPAVAATLLTETLADLDAAGVVRAYLYELWDDPSLTGEQGSYGLFDKDWNPKPIAYAVKALLAQEAPMTEADTAVAQFACTSCHAAIAAPCVTAKGKATTPHAPRLRDARAWLKGAASRQGEVDGLTSSVDLYRSEFVDATITISEDQETIADLRAQVAALTPKPPVVVPPADPATIPIWGTPTWRDEFTAPLDPKVWNIRDGYKEGQDISTMKPRNVIVKDSLLTIQAVKDGTDTGRPWTSGYIDTNGKQAFRYGRWEIRAKMNRPGHSAGIWPAWWFRDSIGGGEFDLLEAVGTPGPSYYHADGTTTSMTAYMDSGKGTKGVDRTDGQLIHLPTPTWEWHTYALEWTPTGMTGLIDGVARLSVKAGTALGDKVLSGFKGGLNQRVDIFVGPTWAPAPDANTDSPALFQVDYVRYWAMPAQ